VLTQERLKKLLSYDQVSGEFRWNVGRGNRSAGSVAGSANAHGYIQIQIDGVNQFAHRLAFLYMTGEFPAGHVDHIDGNVANNSSVNLRTVSCATNIQNQRRAPSSSTTGLLGVSRSGGRWRAYIVAGGKQRHLGCYGTPDEAHSAYLAAKRRMHAGCTI
jgi:hypothetical protein